VAACARGIFVVLLLLLLLLVRDISKNVFSECPRLHPSVSVWGLGADELLPRVVTRT
jgi:hypothetical protein